MILAAAWTLKGGQEGGPRWADRTSVEVFAPCKCEGRVTPSASVPGSSQSPAATRSSPGPLRGPPPCRPQAAKFSQFSQGRPREASVVVAAALQVSAWRRAG